MVQLITEFHLTEFGFKGAYCIHLRTKVDFEYKITEARHILH